MPHSFAPADEATATRPAPSFREVLVVYKKSKLDLYAQSRSSERFTALLARKDALAEAYVAAHEAHVRTLAAVKESLAQAGLRYRTCYRARLTAQETEGCLVVSVGGDGTLLDASHRLSDATVLGVNSDPARSVGFLCAARAEDFSRVLASVWSGALPATRVPRAGGSVDGEPFAFPVLNEVLIAHRNPAATTRYTLHVGNQEESQKSSGVWIAAPAGSTAAIASAGGVVQALEEERLQVRVREAYVADSDPYRLTHFLVAAGGEVSVVSRMREGMIYVDGPHQRVPFPLGARLCVRMDAPPLQLVVTPAMRKRREAMRARAPHGASPPTLGDATGADRIGAHAIQGHAALD